MAECKEQLSEFEVEFYWWVTDIYPRLTEYVVKGVDAGCFGLEEKMALQMSSADDIKHLSVIYLLGKYKQWEDDRFNLACDKFTNCVTEDVWEVEYINPKPFFTTTIGDTIENVGGGSWKLNMEALAYTGVDNPEVIANNVLADSECKYLGYEIFNKDIGWTVRFYIETANISSITWAGTGTAYSVFFKESTKGTACDGRLMVTDRTNLETLSAIINPENNGFITRILCAGEVQTDTWCPADKPLTNYVDQDLMNCIVEHMKCKGLNVSDLLDNFTLTAEEEGFGIGSMVIGKDSPCDEDAFTVA